MQIFCGFSNFCSPENKLELLSYQLAYFVLAALNYKSLKVKQQLVPDQKMEIVTQFSLNKKNIDAIQLEWGDKRYNQITQILKKCLQPFEESQQSCSGMVTGSVYPPIDNKKLFSVEVSEQFKIDWKRGSKFSVRKTINGKNVWVSSSSNFLETENALKDLYQLVFNNNKERFTEEDEKQITRRTVRDIKNITDFICQTPINKINDIMNLKGDIMGSPFELEKGLSWNVGGGCSHQAHISLLPTGAYVFNHSVTINPTRGAEVTLIKESKGKGKKGEEVITAGLIPAESLDIEKTFASYTWSTLMSLDTNIEGNNHTVIMTTPLDIQYKVVKNIKDISSSFTFSSIPELLRNYLTEISRPLIEYIATTFRMRRPS